jgi:predicted AAA+ superfamily ATPase
MRYIARRLSRALKTAARSFPAVVITGPRRAGKTTLLGHVFPRAGYVLLEDPDIRERIRSDPRSFLEGLSRPVVIDEIQNAPELFAYIRSLIDQGPRRLGQWLFTGSQDAPLMQGVTESMAGRAAILQLLPFSVAESPKVRLLDGGYPEALARPQARALWFSSYIQTYLERDVRAVTSVRDLATFRRFLALVAARHGQVLNRSDLAAPLGVSVPTISDWLNILKLTGQVILVPPYFENFGKRLIKSPKIYISDSGLACHLLGITSQTELERSPFLEALFEGFVASEILKSQVNRGGRKELYHFRDQQGLEVDFLFPDGGGKVWMVECKASKTVLPKMTGPLLALRGAGSAVNLRAVVVHRRSAAATVTHALSPGVEAFDLEDFVRELAR